MKIEIPLHAEQKFDQLARQFDHWRQNRTATSEPIPKPLWDQAVSLTTVWSISRVAKGLGVSWGALKKRCAAQQAVSSADGTPAPFDFVELTAPSSWPMPTPSVEVELQRADGARLHMHCRQPQFPVADLIRTFLEAS